MAPGGIIFADSTLIERKVNRTDVTTYYIPATKMAGDNGIPTLANMIIVGSLLENNSELSFEGAETTVKKLVPAHKASLVDLNMKALQLGKAYK